MFLANDGELMALFALFPNREKAGTSFYARKRRVLDLLQGDLFFFCSFEKAVAMVEGHCHACHADAAARKCLKATLQSSFFERCKMPAV